MVEAAHAIRYPRGTGRNPQWRNEMTTVEIGRGTCLREGADVAVLTIGPVADDALQAAEEAAAKSRTWRAVVRGLPGV